MKRKLQRHIHVVAHLFLVLLVAVSCKKETEKTEIIAEASVNATVDSWLTYEADTSSAKKKGWISMLTSSLQMDKAYVETDQEKDRQHTIIPLNSKFESSFDRSKERKPFLILTSTHGRILANIALVKTSTSTLPLNLFTTIFRDDKSRIDIDFILLKSFDRYMFSSSYKNERLSTFTKMTTKDNSVISTNADCTEWYYRTYYYNSDGTLDHYVDETVAIICTGCTPDDPMCVDSGDGSNPEGGGGGGGGSSGGSPEELEEAYVAALKGTESSPATREVTFTSPVEGKKPFNWVIVKNTWDLWSVKSYDEAVGYNSPSTGAVIYRIDHLSSSIAGQTIYAKVRPNGQQTPIVYLTWSETGHSSTIAGDYKSGISTVTGALKDFGITVSTHTNTGTVNVY